MERILNMVMRRLMRKGINSGMKAISKRGEGEGRPSKEDRQLQQQARQSSNTMRQATRALRRINKF